MQRTTEAFVRSLIGVRRWGSQLGQIGEWAAAGRIELLHEVAEAVSGGSCPEGIASMVRMSILEEIVRRLAGIPTETAAETALACSLLADRLAADAVPRQSPASVASLLAYDRPWEALEPLFLRHGSDRRYHEVLACLVQESSSAE